MQQKTEEQQPSLEEIIQEYQRPVYYFVRRLVTNHEDAADITQQVFFQVYRHINKFRGQSSLRTWLYQIAQNLCRSHWRRHKNYKLINIDDIAETLADVQNPEEKANEGEQQQLIQQAVATLPYKQKVTVTLRVYEQMSYQEIGQVLGCSENAAKVNYHHALNQLRACLTP